MMRSRRTLQLFLALSVTAIGLALPRTANAEVAVRIVAADARIEDTSYGINAKLGDRIGPDAGRRVWAHGLRLNHANAGTADGEEHADDQGERGASAPHGVVREDATWKCREWSEAPQVDGRGLGGGSTAAVGSRGRLRVRAPATATDGGIRDASRHGRRRGRNHPTSRRDGGPDPGAPVAADPSPDGVAQGGARVAACGARCSSLAATRP